MAVETTMNQGKRRLVFGLNVAVSVVLMIVIAAAAVWAAGKFGKQLDLTRTGVNSLSPRTTQLLGGLGQEVTITGLYDTALEEVRPHAEKRQKRVTDLLDLYETAGRGKVAAHMIDANHNPAKLEALLKRLSDKPAYKDEAAEHIAVLDAFPELNRRVVEALQAELSEIERLAGADPGLQRLNTLGIIERNMRLMLREAQATVDGIQKLQTDEIPRYGRAVEAAGAYVSQVGKVLEDSANWMATDGQSVAGVSDETRAFFQGAGPRLLPIITELKSLTKRTEDLERVKLEDVYEDLKRGSTILVETEREAEVLSLDDVWPWRADQNAPPPPDKDERDFAGEQALSSAILKLTQKEKTALVFTRFGGQPLLESAMPQNPMMRPPPPPFQGLAQLLEKENFLTGEWDVQTQPDPPTVEGAARTIFVVFPPEPPPQTNPMRPPQQPPITPEQKDRITGAAAESGMAIFLTRWAPPSSQFNPTPGKYEFNDYLQKSWGVAVEETHLALEFAVNPQREGLMYPASRSLLITSRTFHYTDHPIGDPLRGLPAALQAVAPLKLLGDDAKPAGVNVETIIEVDDTEDVWAIGNLSRINEDLQNNQGTRRYDDDIPAPFPLAVAGSQARDGADDMKIVIFASDSFISDAVANAPQMVLVGGAIRVTKLYPGNTDLFVNALHWLTGDADRIAVGPQRGDVPRLDELEDGPELTFTRVFLVGIWPSLALVAGAFVWLARRR